MTFIFRCNAGEKIGLGHLNRSRSLAYYLNKKGQDCLMVGPSKEYVNAQDLKIFKRWIPKNKWKCSNEDSLNLIRIAKKNKESFIILDDYRIDDKYQLNLKKAGLKWLQFFNSENSKVIWADIVHCSVPGISLKKLKTFTLNKKAKFLLGPKYALLRPEFSNIKKRKIKTIKRVILTFGGGYDFGAVEYVLSVLLPVTDNNIKFTVVSGLLNQSNFKLKKLVNTKYKAQVNLYINPKKITKLMLANDLAITAGGTTTYELDVCGLPMIIISTAANQIEQSKAWSHYGRAKYLGNFKSIKKESLKFIFRSFLNKKQKILQKKVLTLGNGSNKVAEFLINYK